MSNSVQPHRRQPNRLPRPWDSPGKNTGVGCHFLLQCTKVKSESEVTQSCPTLCDPMNCSLWDSPGKSTGVGCHCLLHQVVLVVKNPPARRETWVRSLSWENPLEEGMATHSGILAWRIPMDRGPWWAAVYGVARSRTQLRD